MKKRIVEKASIYLKANVILLNIGILLLYFIFGKLGLSLAFVNASTTAIWAPTGIALATLLIFGYRVTPAIFLGAFLVNLTTAGGIATSLGIALGNTLEALSGVYLVRRFANGAHVFDSVTKIFKFIFFAALLGTAVSATIGVTTLILGGLATLNAFGAVWLTWWLGDMGGALIVAPLFLVWANHPRVHFSLRGAVHLFLAILGLLIITLVVFEGALPYPYLCIPLGVWIAFWFGRRGATITTLIVSLIAVLTTIHGMGPFSNKGDINESLLLLELFLSIFSITALVFATTVLEISKSEKVISSQEKRFQALIEKSFDAVVLIDATSKIFYASPTFERIVGYSPDEVIGTIGFNLVHPDDRAGVIKELGKLVLKPGGTVTVEYRTIRKDGKIIWIEANGTNLLLDSAVNAVVVNFRDITERKHQEEETKHNEKRFRSLVEKTGEGIALVDKNRKVIYSSATITDLLGYTQEEYEKMDPSSLIHPDDLAEVQKKFDPKVAKHRASISVQYRAKHKDGMYRWFDVLVTNLSEDEAVKAYVIKYRDITEQKTIEEEIRREKVEDEAMLGSIGDGVIATDNTGKITMINKRGAEILGWEIEELVGKDIVEAIPLEDELGQVLVGNERPIINVLHLGKPIITSSTIFYVRKDKTRFPVHFTVTPIILDKKVAGAIEVFHDITQEKEVDKAKTEFVSVASHQLRTPLATINWYLEELMKSSSAFTEKQVSYLKEVYAASKRMVDLINALLNTSRLEMGTFVVEPGSVAIDEVVKQVLMELAPKIEQKQVGFSQEYAKDLPKMHADPKLLTIIFQNLLSNAIKYTKPQDTITVKVTADTKEFLIQISDHGVGIPKAQQDKIFTKLFRADNARITEPEGTGLGLYIIKSIVDTVGGKIWFESEEKKGTTFSVSFPLSGMKQKTGKKQLI